MKEIEVKSDATVSNWFDSEVSSLHYRVSTRSRVWRPPTDLYETEENIVVRVEIAGMRESDFSISLEDNLVVIQGKRHDRTDRQTYHQMEIRFGEFYSQLELPWPINPEGIKAEYQDGFLWVRLPKAHPRQIKIRK
mgnify:CR=1 FL=1